MAGSRAMSAPSDSRVTPAFVAASSSSMPGMPSSSNDANAAVSGGSSTLPTGVVATVSYGRTSSSAAARRST